MRVVDMSMFVEIAILEWIEKCSQVIEKDGEFVRKCQQEFTENDPNFNAYGVLDVNNTAGKQKYWSYLSCLVNRIQVDFEQHTYL